MSAQPSRERESVVLPQAQTGAPAPTTAARPVQGAGPALLRVAWLSILLGLVMEAALLALTLTLSNVPSLRPFLADLMQKISWAIFVCVGLAFGKVMSNSSPTLTGLMGLLTAPLAFIVARLLHRAALSALAVAGVAAVAPPPFLLALIKGLEYGCLGFAAAWLERRGKGIGSHLLLGLGVAAVFGSTLVAVTASATGAAISSLALLSLAVNEVLFPVGCSLVLYTTGVAGRRTAR